MCSFFEIALYSFIPVIILLKFSQYKKVVGNLFMAISVCFLITLCAKESSIVGEITCITDTCRKLKCCACMNRQERCQ